MNNFEYLVMDYSMTEVDLNNFGNTGWRLISHTAFVIDNELQEKYIFEKEIVIIQN